jgi:uncharacterized protein (TIGR00375 family)
MNLIYADLHVHSSFSRATSKDITIENLSRYGKIKGLNLLSTGDITHPSWLRVLKEKLEEIDDTGIFQNKEGFNFILSGEVSNVYEFEGKIRKVHNLLLIKNFEIADQVNEKLKNFGNLESDGRPIFNGMSCAELVEILMEISKDILIIPAHYLTPWYGLLGSKSGFDSVEECFGEKSKHIFALETGLSSDPSMAFRVSKLDRYTLVSFSDSHTYIPSRIGREFTVFKLKELCYKEIYEAIRKKDKSKIVMTGEIFPQEGKYFFTGHRNCGIVLHPRDAIKLNNICPRCKRKLTVGVLQRIEELADRPEGFVPKDSIPFKHLIPLMEIIAEMFKTNVYSQTVWKEYYKLIEKFGNELNVLLNVPKEDLLKVTNEKIADAIIKVREGKVRYQPGYDGLYGKCIFDEKFEHKKEKFLIQKDLTNF